MSRTVYITRRYNDDGELIAETSHEYLYTCTCGIPSLTHLGYSVCLEHGWTPLPSRKAT